jgi:ABC-type multidrug transport system fused ATPase/permease subunit
MMPVSVQRDNSFSLLEINKKVGMLQLDKRLTVLQQKFSYHGSSELSALKRTISPCTNTIKVFAESINSLIPASEEDVSAWGLRSRMLGTPSQLFQSEIKILTKEERLQKAFWTD